MFSAAQSGAERAFIEQGVAQDMRADGRGRADYREVSVETEVHPGANGSARVVLGQGATEVLAVVKAELSPPSHEQPAEGRLEVNVEVAPLALLNRESAREPEDLNADLSKALESMLGQALDFGALCITPGRFVWTVFLDVMVLEGQGSLIDAISFASYAALRTARIPKIDAISGGLDATNNPIEDFELASTDIAEAVPLPTTARLPVCVSLNRIGNYLVVDTAADEEAEGCVQGRVTVAVDGAGRVCGVLKSASGGFPARELQGITQILAGLKTALGLPDDGVAGGQGEEEGKEGGGKGNNGSGDGGAAKKGRRGGGKRR